EVQGSGARADSDGMRDACHLGTEPFELDRLRSERELTALEDTMDGIHVGVREVRCGHRDRRADQPATSCQPYGRSLMTRAGTPTTVAFAGTSAITAASA